MASTRRRENTRGNNSIDIITSLHSFTDEGENREHAHEHSEYQPSDIISEQDGEISPTNAKSKQKDNKFSEKNEFTEKSELSEKSKILLTWAEIKSWENEICDHRLEV